MRLNFVKQQGFTLIELSVVLLILIALAGLAMPYLSGTSRSALCRATDVTMANVKRVIMERYYSDTLGQFPVSHGGTDYSLKYLFISGGWPDFDPSTQLGWRGPYLQTATTLASSASLGAHLKSLPAAGYVHSAFVDGESVVLDGWGRPLVLQVNAGVARLVSAGLGNGVGVGNADIDTSITGSRAFDDRVLYLNATTPVANINISCTD